MGSSTVPLLGTAPPRGGVGRAAARRLTVGFAALALALTAGLATADDRRPVADAIEVAPHACLTVARLAPDVVRALGQESLDARVSVEIAGETDGVRITVRYDGTTRGVRHIKREARCDDYVGVVAITVAMAIEALVPHPPIAPDAEPAAPVEDATVLAAVNVDAARTSAKTTNPPAEESALRTTRGSSVRPSLRASVESSSNQLPAQAWSFGTAVTFRHDDGGARWRIGTSVVFPTDIAIGESSVEAFALAVDGDVCFAPLRRHVQPLRLCGGVLFGALSARGRDASFARTSRLPFALAKGGLEVVVPLGRGIGWVFGADALVGVVRPELVVNDEGDRRIASRRPPLVGWLVRLGVEWND